MALEKEGFRNSPKRRDLWTELESGKRSSHQHEARLLLCCMEKKELPQHDRSHLLVDQIGLKAEGQRYKIFTWFTWVLVRTPTTAIPKHTSVCFTPLPVRYRVTYPSSFRRFFSHADGGDIE